MDKIKEKYIDKSWKILNNYKETLKKLGNNEESIWDELSYLETRVIRISNKELTKEQLKKLELTLVSLTGMVKESNKKNITAETIRKNLKYLDVHTTI